GVDDRLVPGPRAHSQVVPHARESARRRPRRAPRSSSPRRPHPAEVDEGRLASLRPELLPSLPPRGADAAGNRHVDVPSRLSLHRSRRRSGERAGEVAMIGCGATVRWTIAANGPGPRGRSGTFGYSHLPTENSMANAKSTAGTASKAGSAGD